MRASQSRSGSLRRQLGLLGLVLLAGLASSCNNGSGAKVKTPGGGGGPGADPLIPDFLLRRDLLLSTGFVADVLVVDYDVDGIQDLVETNFLFNQITIARGNPDGSFTTLFTPETDNAAWRVASGDYDANGMIDIAVALVDKPGGLIAGVQIFLQQLDNTFTDAGTLDVPFDPFDIATLPAGAVPAPAGGTSPLGDEILITVLDGGEVWRVGYDGLLPYLVDTLDSSSIGLGKPFSVAVIDEMDDGLLDVAVGELQVVDTIGGGGPLPDRVVVYRNDGTGLQPPIVALSPAFGPAVDNIGDADGNGFDDLGVAQLDADDVVLLGNTPAGFTDVTSIDVGGGSSSVITPDLDGDTVLDLAATIINEYAVVVRMGLAPLTFDEMTRYNVGPVPRSIQTIDLPTDALVDLVLAGPEDLNFLENLGGGNLEAARGFDVGDKPVFLQVVDLDLDGDVDMVTIDHFQENITFLEGDGNGNFEKVATVPLAPGITELPGNFDIGDVDGDLLPDVVVAIHQLAEVRILRNPGSVDGFAPAQPGDIYQMGSLLLGIQVTDLNQDPFPDVVVASSGDDTICIMLGAAGGIFAVQPPVPVPFRPAAMLSEDINDDGFLDVACTADTGPVPGVDPVLGLLSGDGTGALFVEGSLPVTTLGQTLHCGDFDEDGLCDLAAGQPGDTVDSFFVFMNQGAFTFTETSIQVGGNPGALNVADVDRDLHDDIIVPTGLGELRVVFGDGAGGFPLIEPANDGVWPVPFGTVCSEFVDVDGDELPDLLMVSPKSSDVWVGGNSSIPAPAQ